jgi:Glycolipid transfer protein (GLTP)
MHTSPFFLKNQFFSKINPFFAFFFVVYLQFKMTSEILRFSQLKGFSSFDEKTGKICTKSFLESANEVIAIIATFGKLFKPIVSDMQNNSNQISKFYEMDPDSRRYLEDMVLNDEKKISHTWILWLKRALMLIERFFWYVIHDSDVISQKSENLQPMMSRAYEEVLKPYHGFLLQKTFSLLTRWSSLNRRTLLGVDELFNENVVHLRVLMPKMKMHLDKIDKLLKEHGFEDTNKV